jgi:hypothetical protein
VDDPLRLAVVPRIPRAIWATQEKLMHSRTTAALRELEKVSWFLRVGINDGSSVITLSCWPEAIEQCSSFEWEDLRLEAANQYRECIARHSGTFAALE